jgi:hypothetical protein
MDKYRDRFEGGIFSTQGKLGLKSGEVYCQAVQINDVQDGNGFGKPFINLVTEYDLGWHFLFTEDYKSKFDFFTSDFDDIRNEVWEITKKSPNESWLIITKESPTQINNLLPFDWGLDYYPNVWITIVNDDLSIDDELAYIQGNITYLSSKESIDPMGKLVLSQESNSINSCLWVISGIDKSEIKYEIQYIIEE